MKLFFAASLANAIHPSYYFASASPHDIKPTPKTHDNRILNKEQSKHHNRKLKQSCATRVNNTPKKLLQCVTVESVRKHQAAFQDIADANNGTRASGTPGYEASTDYVVEQLEEAGYDVVTQQFPFTYWQVLGPSTLTQISPNNVTYVEDADYTLMAYSSEADVSGAVTLVNNVGCYTSDFDGFSKENIALIQRGGCSFTQKAENAAAAGAVGVVVINQDDTLTVPSLRQAYAGGIPAFFVPSSLGDDWAATSDLVLHMNADTITSRTFSTNVLAETSGGRDDQVVMVGAHLDSVTNGPGIQGKFVCNFCDTLFSFVRGICCRFTLSLTVCQLLCPPVFVIL